VGHQGGGGGPALTTVDTRATLPRGGVRRSAAGRLRVGLAGLFVEAPARPLRWWGAGLATGAVLAAGAVSLARQPGAGALDTVWAEDGSIFLSQATTGALRALVHSYGGYYHAVPRLLAALATLASAGAAPAILAVAAALCVAGVAVLVYFASAGQLSSQLSRVLVAAVAVVVPVGQDEVLNSIANLHWYGLYALFWMLLWVPRRRSARAVSAAAVLLVATSDILALAFAPLALVRALRRDPAGRRDRHGIRLAALLGAGLVVQLAGLLTGSSSRQVSADPVTAVTGYVSRAVPWGLLGARVVGPTGTARWAAMAALAWLLVVVAAGFAWARLTRPAWPLAVAAVLHSAALYALPVVLSGYATPRYAVPAAMLLVTALVALLQPVRAGWYRAPLYMLAVLLAVVWAVDLRVDNARAHGPTWRDQLPAARQECTHASSAALAIPPQGTGTRWQAVLACDYVRH
jgi:hypothetical protein